jgi:hypothetical protein
LLRLHCVAEHPWAPAGALSGGRFLCERWRWHLGKHRVDLSADEHGPAEAIEWPRRGSALPDGVMPDVPPPTVTKGPLRDYDG